MDCYRNRISTQRAQRLRSAPYCFSHATSQTTLMNPNPKKRSEDFLKISDQFQLGSLTTESSHPVTANLSEVAKRDVIAALALLFDVDTDVVRKYREFAASGRANTIADVIVR